jgi:hypothetical protein
MLLKNGPSVHPTVPRVSPYVPTRLTIAPTLAKLILSVHPMVSFLFLFLLGFDPLFSHFGMWFSCILGTYKCLQRHAKPIWLVPMIMLSWITKIKLEVMAYEAMFATISPFLVIYDNTTKARINSQILTELEPLTLSWMLTIIQTPPRSNFHLFDLPFLCSHSPPLVSYPWNLACFGLTVSPFGIKSPKSPKQNESKKTSKF